MDSQETKQDFWRNGVEGHAVKDENIERVKEEKKN